MSYIINIPVTNHSEACTQYYLVQYKISGEMEYNTLYPYPIEPNINITVPDAGLYDIRISRMCCDGETSPIKEITVTI